MAGSSLMRNSIEPSTSASTHNNPSENQSSESVTASAMHDLRQSGINFNILVSQKIKNVVKIKI